LQIRTSQPISSDIAAAKSPVKRPINQMLSPKEIFYPAESSSSKVPA